MQEGKPVHVRKIDHVGVAVRDLEQALRFWSGFLGLQVGGVEVVEEQKVKVAFLPVGQTKVELLQSTDPDGPVARHIESRGEGVQHVAFLVEDIEESLRQARAAGLRLIDEKPRHGAGGARIAFVHPKESNGVLVEFCQRS